MNNNDIFKKLRVALQLRDDQIVEIMKLVDFRISAAELGAFFRNADHPKYMDCGDQVLRNFLNGLVIHLRGTKEEPKNAMDVIKQNQEAVKKNISAKPKTELKSKTEFKPKTETKKKPFNPKDKKPVQKVQIVEKVQYKNGKNKK
ncbi:DUF1456 family protein [Flavobacterium wongokense]|uniref:DUF1456 family protein n=1 Tax=Flavobacterium wongokense TaxID=2910674 RepID=UPI001F2095DB|nr:DUF1456 family protein [Flavobacterium sp. WG47]MCF6132951.1 DUF1456 family protein [Flavobacterium sp. WG47]